MNEIISIAAWDGYALSSTHFIPADRQTGRILLIVNGAGENQKKYTAFASFFSSQGYDAYTFDFRGTGASRQGPVSRTTADLTDWAVLDLDAIISYIKTAHPHSKLIIVAHDTGGILTGMSRLSKNADAVVFIGCQSPYYKNRQGMGSRLRHLLAARVLIPFFNRVFGHLPATLSGLSEDLPRNVVTQLLAFSKSPRAILREGNSPEAGFRSMDQKGLSISFADDKIATPRAVRQFLSFFRTLRVEQWHFTPEQVVHRSVGHSGFFRRSMQSVIWNDVASWLSAAVSSARNKAA